MAYPLFARFSIPRFTVSDFWSPMYCDNTIFRLCAILSSIDFLLFTIIPQILKLVMVALPKNGAALVTLIVLAALFVLQASLGAGGPSL